MDLDRRGLLRSLLGSALGLALAGLGGIAALWTAAIARFLTPNVTDQPPRTFKAGRPDQYSDGQVETKYQPGYGVWVVRGSRPLLRSGARGRPQIFALRAACTHLGCVTQWHEGRQEFRCPCHGSAFTKEGKNVAGPAPRPLERCAIRLAEDGQIEIDTGRTFQEQLGEWDNPESFVEG
jgi:cytochrome b6-f complex iron-sulfur subunit